PVQRVSKTISSIERALQDQDIEACSAHERYLISQFRSLQSSHEIMLEDQARHESDLFTVQSLEREMSRLNSMFASLQEREHQLNSQITQYHMMEDNEMREKKQNEQEVLHWQAKVRLEPIAKLYEKENETYKTLKENYEKENEARRRADPSLMFKKQSLSIFLQYKIYNANKLISKQNAVLLESLNKKSPHYRRTRLHIYDLQHERTILISQISRLQETVNRLNTENSLYSERHERVVSEKMEYHQKLLSQEANLKLAEEAFSELYKKECEDNETLKEIYERALESNFQGKLKITELKDQISKLQCLVQELQEQNCEADTKCDAINQ
ncbi:Chromosome partition protein MukB, partial [Clarias magur]